MIKSILFSHSNLPYSILLLISIASFHIIQHLNHLAHIHALSMFALCSLPCRLLSRSFLLFSPLFSACLPLSGYLSLFFSSQCTLLNFLHDTIPFVSICLSYPPFIWPMKLDICFLTTWWFSFRSQETTLYICILACSHTHGVHSFMFVEQGLFMT